MPSISGSWLRDARSLAGQRAFAGWTGRRFGGLENEECVVDDCGGDGAVLGVAMGIAAGI